MLTRTRTHACAARNGDTVQYVGRMGMSSSHYISSSNLFAARMLTCAFGLPMRNSMLA